ncbi:TolC family protein [Belnapia rosea]|uniref:Outer membrane protein TolC n=1 Tax=Belnapia rosea TaxID=938405 RepID=A0A1G7BN57_9PROT|nr:TolC family protein [Belnapia rosea]SDE28601.1 Outer membrane protein TolC [Belnapia rosea]
MPHPTRGASAPPSRSGRKSGAALAFGLTLALLAGPGHGQSTSAQRTSRGALPGATLESVLGVARQLNPELAARALDTTAARARVIVAGALPDPTVRVMSDDIDRESGPRPNKMIYSFEQDIPLWGRRDLRRQIARAEVGQMTAQAQAAEVELTERVKVAFARYYSAYQAVRRTADLHRAIHGISQVARERYAQGRGEQQEVFRAEVETTRVATEIVRLEAALRSAQGQLNALLVRAAEAPLAPPERLRPLPDARALHPTRLAERAKGGNPMLAADAAAVSGAETNRRLTDRNWYPDITVGAAAIDRSGFGPPGYQAWVAMKVPLQWGLREAQTQEAVAQTGAARARLEAREQQIRGDLAEAVAGFEGSRRTIDLIRRQLLPQAEALVRSGAAGYGFGRVDLATVLRAQHDLAEFRLQLLSAEFDSQRQLAAIERLVGGDL